ncbi:hypothetical protein Bca52824_013769 [Brassica carinata]|uniref:Phosphoribulokinase/uridine kinase domain-containing protein n=1 Tax=Brassica carinata TaxID=52824 RepID=A0A8X7VZ43_BRACI|nr:hypothetical protein Bca52824_013769 [Brassica carinata]
MAVSTIYSTQALNSTHFLTSSPSSSSKQVFFYRRQTNRRFNTIITCAAQQTVVIGLAADSGCGKSTFMRRLTSVFGGAAEPPKGGNPDSNTLINPQKQYADAVIEVLPTQLIPDDNEGKVLRVRLIMKEGVKYFSPVYLFDEGSTISWIPCGRKLTCSYPGIKFDYAPDSYFDHEVSVVEMDGQFDRLDELIYVESHLSNLSTKFYGEVTQQMLKHADFPGSNNGTGLFQTIVGLKIRDLYEQLIANKATAPAEAAKA